MRQLAVHAFRRCQRNFNDHSKRISLLALYFYLFIHKSAAYRLFALPWGWSESRTERGGERERAYQDVRSPVLIDRAGTPHQAAGPACRPLAAGFDIRVLIICRATRNINQSTKPKTKAQSCQLCRQRLRMLDSSIPCVQSIMQLCKLS